MKSNFNACLSHVLASEGGYVDHPRDPGGATNMGITFETLKEWRGTRITKTDVRNLTREEAASIYRARYWDVVRGDDLPAGLDLVAFDAAVNSGPSRGIKWLQAGLGAIVDGKMGPATMAAIGNTSPSTAINRACDMRMTFLRGLDTWSVFGKGWSSRVEDVRATALRMALRPASAPTHQEPSSFWTDMVKAILGIIRGK